MSTNEELRLLREYPLYPQSCSHGEETWYCDGCRHGWEKALTAWNMKRKELLARHPEPAAPAPSETDRERARKWLRQFRYDDMQTDSLAAEFAANRSEHSAAVKEADEIVEACAMAVDTAYRRNMSGENWHSRAMNCVRALKGTFALKGEEEPR